MTSTTKADAGASRSTLVDIAKCIGCRACQVACKQWNDRDGESTTLEDSLGFQNPAMLSARPNTNARRGGRRRNTHVTSVTTTGAMLASSVELVTDVRWIEMCQVMRSPARSTPGSAAVA